MRSEIRSEFKPDVTLLRSGHSNGRSSSAATSTLTKKLRSLTPEKAHEALAASRCADHVRVFLHDGRVLEGAVLFNEFKGTARIINIVNEVSVDIRAEDVRDVRY